MSTNLTELSMDEVENVSGGILPVLIAGVAYLELGATVASIGVGAHMLYRFFRE